MAINWSERSLSARMAEANKRLTNIEKYAQQGGEFESLIKHAYAKAEHAIGAMAQATSEFNTTADRFSTKLIAKNKDGSFNQVAMRKFESAINEFLNSKTSTKTAAMATFKARAKSLNDQLGTNFSWSDMANLFESGMWEQLKDKGYGSLTILSALGKIKNLRSPKRIQNVIEGKEILSDDDAENQIIQNLLAEGYTRENLF